MFASDITCRMHYTKAYIYYGLEVMHPTDQQKWVHLTLTFVIMQTSQVDEPVDVLVHTRELFNPICYLASKLDKFLKTSLIDQA